MADQARLLSDFKRFVTDAESGGQYTTWASANPAEAFRWLAFRNAILIGSRPPVPLMTTAHGRELVDAGVLYLDAIPLRVTVSGKPLAGMTLTAAIV